MFLNFLHQEKKNKDNLSDLSEGKNFRPFIYAQGRNLYLRGQNIHLKGVNIGGFLLQEFWMTPTKKTLNIRAQLDLIEFLEKRFGLQAAAEILRIYEQNYFTEQDFENLYQLGFNFLRLPFWYRNIVDSKGEFKQNWYEIFDWFLEQAAKRKMYVLLDFQGAPGSQNGKEHSGIEAEDKQQASQFFFGPQVEENQRLFIKIWQALATRYKDHPYLLGYDLLNEPFCTYRYSSNYSELFLHQILWNLYHKTYQAIRAIDNNHLIVFQAVWDPEDLPNPQKFAWQNVVYQYHQYLFENFDNRNNKQYKAFAKKIQKITNSKHNVPVLLGEFTLFEDLQAWDQALKLLQEKQVHWAIWTYKVNLDPQNQEFEVQKNWGLYHQHLTQINLETASLQEIKNHYRIVGSAQPNQPLLQVLSQYLQNS